MGKDTLPWEPNWSPVGQKGCTVRVKQRSLTSEAQLLHTGRNEEGRATGYERHSLGFGCFDAEGHLLSDRVEKAKKEAIKLSNLLLEHGHRRLEPDMTFGRLFDRYRDEHLPHRKRASDRRREAIKKALTALENFFGRGFKVEDFTPDHWRRYQSKREDGVIDHQGRKVEDPDKRKPVSAATADGQLQVLKQAFIWAADEALIDRVPARKMKPRTNEDPPRPIVTDDLLEGLREEAPKLTMRLRGDGENREVRTYLPEMIEVANGTGQRLGAIINLRRGDCLWDRSRYGAIRWRGEHDKNKRTRVMPITEPVRRAVDTQLEHLPTLLGREILHEDDPLWPAPDSNGRLRKDVAIDWLQEAERAARGHHVKGFGYHAFRRRWATKNKHLPRKTAAHLGGWKGPHTMERVYQQVTEEDMERALFGEQDDAAEEGAPRTARDG